jgi:hypothetical protein
LFVRVKSKADPSVVENRRDFAIVLGAFFSSLLDRIRAMSRFTIRPVAGTGGQAGRHGE